MSDPAVDRAVRPLRHPLLRWLRIGSVSLTLAACGGGGSDDKPAAPDTPPAEATQRDTPMPFWVSDVPIRANLAHLFPSSNAAGAITRLSDAETRQVQAAARETAAGKTAARVTDKPSALPSSVAVQRRTVTGLFSDSYHTAAGATQLPFDLTGSTIEALAPDGLGGFERIAATSQRADGSYLISGVPEGGHWVHINTTWVWTDSAFIDWGSDGFGRIDTEYANNPTLLTFNATNLDAWQSTDQLAWSVPMQGTSLTVSSPSPLVANLPATGDTALGNFSLDFGTSSVGESLFIPLLSAIKGDQAYLNQLGTAAGNDYRTLVRSLVVPAITQVDGAPNAINSGFLDVTPSSRLTLTWDRPSFASRLAEVNPTAVASSSVLALSTSALAPDYGVPGGAFSLMEFNTFGDTALDFGQVHYGNPFPSDWAQIMESYHGFTVHYMAPGATVALPFERFLYGVDLVPTASADPTLNLTPRMTPPRSVSVNGKSLFENQLAVGTSPTFSWEAPAIGTPDRYQVTLRRLFANGTRSESRTVGRFYTGETSMVVPPDLLQPGQVYFLTISAISAGSPTSSPARSKLPYAFATMMSALISP